MREITFEQAQAMDLETAKSEMCNRVYEAAILFERFENAGKVHGNGHHMAQKVAAFAEAMMAERWIANAAGQGAAKPYPAPASSGCGCLRCTRESGRTVNGLPEEMTRMILCPRCGNKRCPHANDHRNACTNSNEPGQPGSIYGPNARLDRPEGAKETP